MTDLKELLRTRQSFVLTGHEHPDGDCLGSQVGLYHLLRALGAEVAIMNPDPVARSLRYLQKDTPILNYREAGMLTECDVLVLLDCANLSRLGEMEDAVRGQNPQIVVIDHHVGSEDGDGTVCLVDVSAAATGVLVYRLYKELGVEIPPEAAVGLFTSIVADTGWFRYSNTDRPTMEMAGELIDLGVQPDAIYDRMFRDQDPQSIQLLSDSLATHQFRLGGRLVVASLDMPLMSRIGRSGFDTDSVLEPLRSVEGVEVAALFKQIPGGAVKLSLRSMGGANVQAIAAHFGGGGHVKAAGATMQMSLQEAIDAVEDRVRQATGGGR